MQKHRWLIMALEAADDETVLLPWSRRKGRAKRKAAARARAIAA